MSLGSGESYDRRVPETLGRYRLIRRLAIGGMAEIYLARVTGIGGFEKNVVLKRILPQLAETEQFFRMFLDEARIAATLQHPNVIQVYDAGEDRGEYFIAMEHLEGADLLEVERCAWERDNSFPIVHAIHIATGVAAGLHYAHEKVGLDGTPLGIIHRDVTPHNIFLTRAGGVKLVDFGIAKATNRISRTSYGTLKGKLAYMSPEQCQGEPLDRRSDIYSLGVVLYEMTTGERLYRAKSEYLVLKDIVEGEISPPSEIVEDFPPALDRIIMRALEKDRDRRYQTARELERDLFDFARGESMSVSPLSVAEWLEPILRELEEQEESRPDERAAIAAAAGAPGERRKRPSHLEDERGYASGERAAGDDRRALEDLLEELQEEEKVGEPRPAAPPVDVAVRDDWEPEEAPIDISLKRGHTMTWLFACMLVVGAGTGLWFWIASGDQAAEELSAGTASAEEAPRTGRAIVESDPDGAEVWLSVGRAPLERSEVDPSRPQELLIEHEGYQGKRIRIDRDDFTRDSRGRLNATVTVALEPLAPARGKGARDRSPGPPGERRGEGRAGGEVRQAGASATKSASVRVETEPPAARVWLRVGDAPATLEEVATDRRYEFRLELEGHAPSFVAVEPADFGAAGRARVRAGMAPADD